MAQATVALHSRPGEFMVMFKRAAWAIVGAATLAAQAEQASVGRIEIIGARVASVDDNDTITPVQVIDRDAIRRSGAATLIELIGSLRTVGTGMVDTAADFTDAEGASGAALRGFGHSATLVLLNGRRLSNYPMSFYPNMYVNLDSLPLGAIERVEILKSGGAAQYGSEAIAGVINIVTRTDLRGVTVRAEHEQSVLNGEFGSSRATITGGWGDWGSDGFNVLAHGEVYRRNPVFWREVVGYANDAFLQRVPTLLSSFSFPGNLGSLGPVPGCQPELIIDGLCMYDRYSRFQAVSQTERASFYSTLRGRLNGRTEAFGEVFVGRTSTDYEHPYQAYGTALAPQTWFDPASGALREFHGVGLPAGHPLNTTGTDGLPLRYRFADAPSRHIASNIQYRVFGGLRGELSRWRWETTAGVTGGRSHLDQRGAFSADGFRQVIGNWDAPDPQFFNRAYRIGGPNTPDVLDTLFPGYGFRGSTRQVFADGKLQSEEGTLWSRPLVLTLGADLRNENLVVDPSDRLRRGDIVGFGVREVDAARSFGSVYSEANLNPEGDLAAQLAVRVDKFTGVSPHLSPKLGLRWRLNPALSLRATVETGFRTPNLVESGSGANFGFSGQMRDPARCSQAIALQNDLKTAALALPAGDPARVSLLARSDIVFFNECAVAMASTQRENANLKPETSRNGTLGLAFHPSKALSTSIDYWHIFRRNEIATEGAQALLDRNPVMPNPAPGEYGITRGDLATDTTFTPNEQATYGVTAGQLRSIVTQFRNIGRTRASGVDLAGTSSTVTPLGRLDLSLNATYLINYQLWDATLGRYGANMVGKRGPARWAADLSASLTHGRFSHTLAGHYSSPISMRADANDHQCADQGYTDAQCRQAATVTWNYGIDFNAGQGLALQAMVRNVFNHRPPNNIFAASVFENPYTDTQGRMMKLGVEYAWR